jgi:hypothetical protein
MFQQLLQQFLYTAMFVVGIIGLSAVVFAVPVVGAHFIRSIVRGVNRHDDPRHAKRPPDPP